MSRLLFNLALKGTKTTSLLELKSIKRFPILSSALNHRFLVTNDTSKSITNEKNNSDTSTIKNDARIWTIPNLLTLSRIASIPFINYYIFVDQHQIACALFAAAAITDFLDGYIARRFPNQSSQLGSILDPLADKLLIGTLAVTLTCNNMFPLPLLVLILGRDVSLIAASLYIRYTLVEKPVTLAKFVNVSKYAPVQVKADQISKFNTFLQLSLITLTLPSSLFAYQDASFLIALQYLTGFTTILSSISYLYKRGSYKVVDDNNKRRKS